MPQRNVELVRRGWDMWSRGDVDGLFSLLAPDVVYDTTHLRDWPVQLCRPRWFSPLLDGMVGGLGRLRGRRRRVRRDAQTGAS